MSENLASALAAAQADMPAVDKDGTNPHFRAKFVSLDNLIAKTRPVLNKHGLSISQWPSMDNGLPALTTRITHTSGESMEDTMPLFLGKTDMQALGAAITYARRYSWASALGIASDEDDDHEAAAAKAQPEPAPSPEPEAANGKVTRAQVTRLFAIARERQIAEERIREIVKQMAGVDSTKEVPKDKYDAVIGALEAEDIPF